jgi:hypothetical protein
MKYLMDKKVSKIYRKMLTSNEIKAVIIYEKLSDELKFTIKNKLNQNGSKRAKDLLHRLQ